MILLAALLCNYGRGFCLIDVGTEGGVDEARAVSSGSRAWTVFFRWGDPVAQADAAIRHVGGRLPRTVQ
jgi:hypothetical protein